MKTRITRNGTPNLSIRRSDGGQGGARRPDTDSGWQGNTRATRRRRSVLCLTVLAGLTLAIEAHAVGETTRVSVDSNGEQSNDHRFSNQSRTGQVSADSRFVAFGSSASNLVRKDTNGLYDVFVHDRRTGETSRVSVSSTGKEGNEASGFSGDMAISADGRFVTFQSDADNLVADDSDRWEDIFVHDRQTHETTRVSVASDGTQANGWSRDPAISANGRFVAFASAADNLVPGDTNRWYDVFVHDRTLHQTTRVSVDSAGGEGHAGRKIPLFPRTDATSPLCPALRTSRRAIRPAGLGTVTESFYMTVGCKRPRELPTTPRPAGQYRLPRRYRTTDGLFPSHHQTASSLATPTEKWTALCMTG